MSNFASANDFIGKAKQFRHKLVDTPLGNVWVRSLTAGEWVEFGSRMRKENDYAAGLWMFGVAAVREDKATPLFNELDREKLPEIDAAILQPIIAECVAHILDDQPDTEAAVKNSDATTGGDSPTG